MTEFQSVDELPPRGQSDALLAEFAIALRNRPGRWHLYPNQEFLTPDYRRKISCRISTQRIVDNLPPQPLRGDFQSAVRGGLIYVRYIGRPAAHSVRDIA